MITLFVLEHISGIGNHTFEEVLGTIRDGVTYIPHNNGVDIIYPDGTTRWISNDFYNDITPIFYENVRA